VTENHSVITNNGSHVCEGWGNGSSTIIYRKKLGFCVSVVHEVLKRAIRVSGPFIREWEGESESVRARVWHTLVW